MAASDAQLDRMSELLDQLRVMVDRSREELRALRGRPADPADGVSGLLEWFKDRWSGPLEADLWRDFPTLVQGHERELQANLAGWTQHERYRTGFHGARSFLRSGVWHRPAPQAIAPVPRKQAGPRNPFFPGGAA